MMKQDDIVDLLVEKSIAVLQHDAENPDVGMGMLPFMAIDPAWEDLCREAARWNSLEALRLKLTDEIRDQALTKIRARKNGHYYY